MPEFAEVEFYRKRWNPGLGRRVRAVRVHPRAKVFRVTARPAACARELTGATLLSSAAAAKQMLFRFQRRPLARPAPRHERRTARRTRRLHAAEARPPGARAARNGASFSPIRACSAASGLARGGSRRPGGRASPPPILSDAFTVGVVAGFLRRRGRAPVKAVLLMQERFPGLGNWMADEILWRAAIHPRRPAGSLRPPEVRRLWRECRRVCRLALATIAGRGDDLPPALNVRIPDSWLFNHRWENGGRCPRTGAAWCARRSAGAQPAGRPAGRGSES